MGKRGVLMLQRLVRCVIIGFWLGTMGTFLLREWQYHRSLPPALTESFTDATTEPIEWHVFRRTRGPDGQWLEPMAVGVIVSQVQRDEQSGIVCIVHQLEMDVGQVWHELPIPESAGQLRLESRLDAGLFGELQRLRIVGGWSAWGRWLIMLDVIPRHDGEATMRWMLNLPGGVWRQESALPWSLKALPVNSLGPPDRLPSLRPGQSWALPWVNALRLSGVPGGVHTAVVEPKPVNLTWQGQTYSCLVVRVRQEPVEMQWWVAQQPPLRDVVLQQVVGWGNMELLVIRQTQVTRQDLLVPPAWLYRMP
jgi:hypothetical protein